MSELAELIARRKEMLAELQEIESLAAEGADRILEAVKAQRWYFFRNNKYILMDRDTGLLWANLDYFEDGDVETLEENSKISGWKHDRDIIDDDGNCNYTYRVFRTSRRTELQHSCEDDRIDPETWGAWFSDWQALRLEVERKLQPFVPGGELSDKFETDAEFYKRTSKFQADLQGIIFSCEKSEDRIFILNWADSLLDIQIGKQPHAMLRSAR